jgi:hypothetical protein
VKAVSGRLETMDDFFNGLLLLRSQDLPHVLFIRNSLGVRIDAP